MSLKEGLWQLESDQNLEPTVLSHQKSISLRTRRTNMTAHMIRSTVAHITIPPCFCVLSACKPIFPLVQTQQYRYLKQLTAEVQWSTKDGDSDLLQLLEAILDCTCNVLNVVVYPINNSALFGETYLVRYRVLLDISSVDRRLVLTWSITRTDRSFIIWASSFTDSTTCWKGWRF